MRIILGIVTLAFAATLAVAGAIAIPAKAADTANTNIAIAVVDIQQIIKDAKAAQAIDSQLAGVRKSFQADVEKEEKSLRAAEKEIMDKKASMSEDELKAKVQEFQKKVAASQKKIQDKKGKLDKAFATANGKLRGEILRVVADIGDKKNLDLVLARTDVVIVSKTLDITAEVLERINKDLPTVKVELE